MSGIDKLREIDLTPCRSFLLLCLNLASLRANEKLCTLFSVEGCTNVPGGNSGLVVEISPDLGPVEDLRPRYVT